MLIINNKPKNFIYDRVKFASNNNNNNNKFKS